MENKHDPVNHPSHYAGNIEAIDYIQDKLSAEEFVGYCCGNVLKYVSRWRKKDGVQDLKKAAVYLNWMIENVERACANYVHLKDEDGFSVCDLDDRAKDDAMTCGSFRPRLIS